MSTSPFGALGSGFPFFDPARWADMAAPWMAGAAPARPQPTDPLAWWTPRPAPAPAPAFDPTALANQWMTQMQQLAAQFGGRDAQAADVARAWRVLVGENPFAQATAAGAFMPPAFAGLGARGPLDLPAFGYTREHQERGQAFARVLSDFQQASQAFNTLVAEAGQEAFARFESLLATRAADGKPVESARGLFDLWIDAAEDAYADIALGDRFQKAFGDYVNAQMRVRASMQKEVELACAQWGIPGRAEIDAAHRKVADLEREVRRLRDAIEARAPDAPPAATTPKAAPAAGKKPAGASASSRPRKGGR